MGWDEVRSLADSGVAARVDLGMCNSLGAGGVSGERVLRSGRPEVVRVSYGWLRR